MIDRFEQFTAAISSIYRFVQKIERDQMEKYGLKGAAAQYLMSMDRHPEGITAAALCEICRRDKAAVSRILSEMESKGLVTRMNPGDNQYRAKLVLTPLGKEAADYASHKAAAAAAMAGRELTEADRKIFYASLFRIASNIETLSREGIPDNEE